MKKEKPKKNTSDLLRKTAEKKLETTREELSDMSDMDVVRLVHELHVHQIELEMQNEELRKTHSELEESKHKVEISRQKYSNLYNFAPAGYITLNKDGIIKKVNLAAADMLGSENEDLIEAKLYSFIPDENKDNLFLHLRKAFETSEKQTCEIKLMGKNSEQTYAQVESIVVDENTEKVSRTILTDITKRKLAEESMEKAFQEKKDLHSELQHRAKNSFNMISSMIKLMEDNSDSMMQNPH